MSRDLVAIVLAAGLGTRMKTTRAKVLHEVFGISLIERVLNNIGSLRPKRILVVVGYDKESVIRSLKGSAEAIWQRSQHGTAHAVKLCERALKNYRGNLLVVPGDMPLIKRGTLRHFVKAHREGKLSMSVLSARMKDPYGYGRIVRDRTGDTVAIREELDATPEERMIHEVNTGIYCVDAGHCFRELHRIRSQNKKGEFYLTDLVSLFHRLGLPLRAFPFCAEEEALGVNDREDLMHAHQTIRRKVLVDLMKSGVTIVDPATTWIADGATIGRDTVIYPFTFIESGVRIGKNCKLGPFCKIRSRSSIKDGSAIGSFVELVRSEVGKKTRIKHLSYIGDALIGDNVNIGAGTITANFDGKKKSKTKVQNHAFVGSNTVLVAPVTVGRGAKTGAGSVVPKKHNVKAGDTVVGVPAKTLSKRRSKRK